MSNALRYYNDHDTLETERFVRIFDGFFDSLNTRHPDAGVHARKQDLNPYRTPTDTRFTVLFIVNTRSLLYAFQWLEEGFLGYLAEWKNSVKDWKSQASNTWKLYTVVYFCGDFLCSEVIH